MKHDITSVLLKHINELNSILAKYEVENKHQLVATSESDIVFERAVLMSVGYIGELSKHIADDIKQSDKSINWRRLSNSRNIIFHDYDIVDMEIISSVIFNDISQLAILLNKK